MIEKMTKYSFVLLNGEQEEFLSKLQDLGVVDVTRSAKPIDETSAAMLDRAQTLKSAQDTLAATSFEGIIPSKVDVPNPGEYTFELIHRLKDLYLKEKEANKEINDRLVWGTFDKNRLEGLEALGYKIRYYQTPTKNFNPEWENLVALQVINDDGKKVSFVTISDEQNYTFPINEKPAPEGDVTESQAKLKAITAEIADVKSQLLGLKENLDCIENQYHDTLGKFDLYLADQCSEKAVESHIILIEGFSPVELEQSLTEEFDKMDVLWFKEEAVKEDNPPIKLISNKFTKLFAPLTDMYGRPEYNGFDPTPFIAIFFLLFFAFCMGDAGYGLVIILAGLMMKKMAAFKDMSGLVTVLGAGTLVIGLFFHTFFSSDMMEWSFLPQGVKNCFLPSSFSFGGQEYDGTMVLAIIVGIVHLCVAMVVKSLVQTKQNGLANSLGTWGWTLLIAGGSIVGGFALAGVLESAVTKWVLIVLGVVSALGIFIFNDIHRNPLINIGAGLWDTYNTATGLLGDVLSYLRLYALGLGGSMLGKAFNTMAGMASEGGSIPGWIGFVLIVVVGHVLNIAIAALGAFVHPLRLNFLEFFKNSGYTTSGRKYTPLYNKKDNK